MSEWDWMVGRRFSLGTVVYVSSDTATVRHGDDDVRVLLSELLEDDYNARDRYEASMSEAMNTGDGTYRP